MNMIKQSVKSANANPNNSFLNGLNAIYLRVSTQIYTEKPKKQGDLKNEKTHVLIV